MCKRYLTFKIFLVKPNHLLQKYVNSYNDLKGEGSVQVFFDYETDESIRFEGYEPRLVKKFIENKIKNLGIEPNIDFQTYLDFNGKEVSIYGSHLGTRIYIRHVIFAIIRAK